MTLSAELVAILACPMDHEALLYFESEHVLYNPRLRRKYRIENDIPILLIEEAEVVDEAEHQRLMALHPGGGTAVPKGSIGEVLDDGGARDVEEQ
ncbi:MAG: Trm112 family protein [Ferrimicrobium sp.]|uniref:Trm112 family protein n=1 Tax=Ferrimicrobium acidiphilum TaxID=121039 RepID=A0ABV3Y188_9ACTN|nr:Trm112 family protein [Ferrimicrobium sp.]